MGDFTNVWGTKDRYTPVSFQRSHFDEHGNLLWSVPLSYNAYTGGHYRVGRSSNPRVGGWRYPSNYERGYTVIEVGSGSIRYPDLPGYPHSGYTTEEGTFNFLDPGDPDLWDWERYSVDTDNLQRKAETEAMNRLQQGTATVGQNLAELHKTSKEMAKAATELCDIWRGFKTGDVPRITRGITGGQRNLEKILSDRWLSYSYGWKPLVSDLYDLVDAVKHMVTKDQMIRSSAAATDTAVRENIHKNDTLLDLQCSARVKVVIHCKVQNPHLANMASLGLLNPALIAWELLPYSFICDWMFPVGQVLGAFSATAGLAFISGSRSLTVSIFGSGSYTPSQNSTEPGYAGSGSGAISTSSESVTYRRQVYEGYPFPSLYYKDPLSWAHAENAAALVAQML